MFSPMQRGARLPLAVLTLALAVWLVNGAPAFAHGGGGGGGGGHGGGGGGHGGGGQSGGGGYHGGGYYGGGYHRGAGYYGGGYYGGGYGFFPGYYYGLGGYGYGYGNGYGYTYYNFGYSYPNAAYTYPSYGYDSSAYATVPVQGRYLGIDEQAVADASGQGMQVARVHPGTAAEQAGLQVGDVIYSANGYLTQQHGNLAWIIATVPSNGVLQMTVRTARDGATHVISARLP
jgi:hypothetical protein